MAEAKQSGRMVLRKKTKSSLTLKRVKSSSNKGKRLIRGNQKHNGNGQMSTSHKDALHCNALQCLRGLMLREMYKCVLQHCKLSKYYGYQSEFSLEDDLAIIRFVLESNRYMKADRRKIWLKMSSEKVTKHSWLKMRDRYKQVIQQIIDNYPIPKEDANKLRSSRSDDMSKTSLKYHLRSASSNRDGILVTENFRRQLDDDIYFWFPIKRHCRSEGQCNSQKKARHLTAGTDVRSGTDDFSGDAALNALPKYKRMKASDLQLKVINFGNEKCNIERETVSKQYTKISKKHDKVSDGVQTAAEFDDLRTHVTLLSDVSLNESADERLKTTKKDKNVKYISSLSRNRRRRKSETEALAVQSVVQRHSNQTDTSVSEEMFSPDEILRRLLQPWKDKGKSPATAAGTSDDHQQPTVLPLAKGESKVLPTNCLKNFFLSDSPDDCIEVSDAEETEDFTVKHNEETERHLLVCQKLMTWLNVSPEVFAQTVLMNSGNVDDGIHWLLFNKTASENKKSEVKSDVIWDLKDDKDLLNGDEEVYKRLEENYGEMLIFKRQKFLSSNSSALHL